MLLTGLGDVVRGIPVANAIKRQWTDAHLTWVVEPGPSSILRPQPSVDDVVLFRRRHGVRGVRELWSDMRGRRFDLTLNLNIYFKSVFPTLFSRARRRVGFARDRSRDGVWLASNEHLPVTPRRHIQEMLLDVLDHIGIDREPVEWSIPITAEERAEQQRFFAPLAGQPVIGVVGTSARPGKNWPAERYPDLIDSLADRFGAQVILLGGRGAEEQAVARMIVEKARGQPIWGLGDSLRRLVWLIDGCDAIIAPDTGPVHIARALDVPVVGLYGQTNPWHVGPYRKFEELWIDKYTDDVPDPSQLAPKPGRMELIAADEILKKVERALSAPG